MRIVDIRDVRTHLSRLIDKAALGKAFVITRAGKPMVKVLASESPAPYQLRRVGFMAGRLQYRMTLAAGCRGDRTIVRR